MTRRVVIRRNRYFDSVFLMQVAKRMAGQPGILNAFAVLGTEANRRLLADLGYGAKRRDAGLTGLTTVETAATDAATEGLATAGPNDLVLALEGEEAAVAAVASDPDAWLLRDPGSSSGPGGAVHEPRSLEEAVRLRPGCGVAVISVPGEYAAREAGTAIRRGLNVFLFSSNVSLEDELSLKTEARSRGLIVMGPDCGTAFLGGAGIGFANAVRRGPIGIIGSTGTGMQEFSSLVHQAGSGISHGIGTGSRDLSDTIGGISTMTAIDALDSDLGTKVIAVLSKPPGAATTARLMARLRSCRKPVVICLLGSAPAHAADSPPGSPRGEAPAQNVFSAPTIDTAVAGALQAVGVTQRAGREYTKESYRKMASPHIAQVKPGQRYLRGLFAGGTFCYQSQVILREAGLVLYSNSPLAGVRELVDPRVSRENSLVDMGAEVFVEGRPHPMIDATLRGQRLLQEGEDPSVALILLDFILGAVSSPDPVGDLREAIRGVQAAARRRGEHVCIVASVCGTDEDAQGLEAQSSALRDAGALVFSSSAQAAAFCREAAMLLAERRGTN